MVKYRLSMIYDNGDEFNIGEFASEQSLKQWAIENEGTLISEDSGGNEEDES
jgi:hypothetical protein